VALRNCLTINFRSFVIIVFSLTDQVYYAYIIMAFVVRVVSTISLSYDINLQENLFNCSKLRIARFYFLNN